MYKLMGVSALALATAGCAYVPELESQDTFNYAEIITQIECETYFSVQEIETTPEKYGPRSFDDWALSIEIKPFVTVDSQVTLAALHKPVTKKTDWFQWSLGGTSVSSSGLSYEAFGTANVDNQYHLKIINLYELTKDKNGNPLILLDEQKHKRLNKNLTCLAPDGEKIVQTQTGQIMNREGFFGVAKFLDDSLAGTRSDRIDVNSLSYNRQYKARVQVGVTGGWYVATGNLGPSVGTNILIDNTVSLTFKKETPGGPAHVIVDNLPKGGVAPKAGPAPAKAKPAGLTTNYKVPFTLEEQNSLSNAANMNSLQQSLKNALPQ